MVGHARLEQPCLGLGRRGAKGGDRSWRRGVELLWYFWQYLLIEILDKDRFIKQSFITRWF